MEKFRMPRRAAALVGLSAGLLAMTGCANYSGNGNEFVVTGRVTHPGEESLKAEITSVQDAHGEASDWFEVGKEHQLHDNCDCHGFWSGNKQYGVVLDYAGAVIEPIDVPVDACVEFTGKIRSDQEGKSYDNRPVYDVARVVPCG